MPRLLSSVFRILSPDSSLNTLIEETGDRIQETGGCHAFYLPYSVFCLPTPPSIHFLFLRTSLALAEVFVVIGESIHRVPEQADNRGGHRIKPLRSFEE